jgi:uncharacterized protein DUF1330
MSIQLLMGGAVMKPYQKIAVALVVGAAMGGAAIQTIHAQAKTAYVIVAIRSVTDAANYKTVGEKAPGVVAAAGGHLIVATNAIASLDGKPPQTLCAYRLR